MSSQLEQFIRDHREEFDTEDPAPKVWEGINQDLGSGDVRKGPIVRIDFLRWSVAAAVTIGVVAGIWYFSGSGRKDVGTNLAASNKSSSPISSKTKDAAVTPQNTTTSVINPKDTLAAGIDTNTNPAYAEEEGNYKEELYHFAKIVEIKHKELKRIEKDEPLLYKQFAGDVSNLDSVYHSLQEQLTKNPNREQLLEAMIQNLQLQMRLLNHQLDIIKQINHSKKSEYENAYKSI